MVMGCRNTVSPKPTPKPPSTRTCVRGCVRMDNGSGGYRRAPGWHAGRGNGHVGQNSVEQIRLPSLVKEHAVAQALASKRVKISTESSVYRGAKYKS